MTRFSMPRPKKSTSKITSVKGKRSPAKASNSQENGAPNISKLKRKDLVQICECMNVLTKGKKEELIRRLLAEPNLQETLNKLFPTQISQLPSIKEELKPQVDANLNANPKVDLSIDLPSTNSSPQIFNTTYNINNTLNINDGNHSLVDDLGRLQLSPMDPSEVEASRTSGWCIVHGNWTEKPMHNLVMKQGRVLLRLSNGFNVPFFLKPSYKIIPDGCEDNLVCDECMLRNEIARKRPRISTEARCISSASPLTVSDDDFVEKVEQILNTTIPGSEEERRLLFHPGDNLRVTLSPC